MDRQIVQIDRQIDRYIHRQLDGQVDSVDRQIDRQILRQIDRQIKGKKERQDESKTDREADRDRQMQKYGKEIIIKKIKIAVYKKQYGNEQRLENDIALLVGSMRTIFGYFYIVKNFKSV